MGQRPISSPPPFLEPKPGGRACRGHFFDLLLKALNLSIISPTWRIEDTQIDFQRFLTMGQ